MITVQNRKEIEGLKVIKATSEELRPNVYKEDVHNILAFNKGDININVVDEKLYRMEQFTHKPFEIYSMIPAFIIKCLSGSVDVFIKDKRNYSNTSQNETVIHLSNLDYKSIYIPEACCYSLLSLSDNTVVSVKANQLNNNSNTQIVPNSQIGFNFAPYLKNSKLDKSYYDLLNS